MKIYTLQLPPIMTNCYIAYEKEGGKCFIIDPASCAEKIITAINMLSLKPKAILLTHGHFDHIAAADELREKYSVPLYIHSEDGEMIKSPLMNCSIFMSDDNVTLKDADKFLKDGDKLKLDDESFTVMHTPGHSKGSCVFVCSNAIISGDTIFKGTYGRYDLFGGDYGTLMESLKKVLSLSPVLDIYPGHDEKTTVAEESIHY